MTLPLVSLHFVHETSVVVLPVADVAPLCNKVSGPGVGFPLLHRLAGLGQQVFLHDLVEPATSPLLDRQFTPHHTELRHRSVATLAEPVHPRRRGRGEVHHTVVNFRHLLESDLTSSSCSPSLFLRVWCVLAGRKRESKNDIVRLLQHTHQGGRRGGRGWSDV